MTQLAPTQGITTQGTPGASAAAVEPIFQHDYPNPRARPHVITLRTWTQSPPLLSIFALPPDATNYDWPVPRGRVHPTFLRGYIDKFKNFPPSPINYDFPNPRGRSYPQDLRTFTIPLAINLLIPFKNYDFPNPIGRPYPVNLRIWSQTPHPSFTPIPGSLLCTEITAYWIIGGNPEIQGEIDGDPDAIAAVTGNPDTEVCD